MDFEILVWDFDFFNKPPVAEIVKSELLFCFSIDLRRRSTPLFLGEVFLVPTVVAEAEEEAEEAPITTVEESVEEDELLRFFLSRSGK